MLECIINIKNLKIFFSIHITGVSTNPKKLTLLKTYIAWLNVWRYTPIFFVFDSATIGAFSLHFLDPSELFFGLGSGSTNFFYSTNADNQLCFWKYSPTFLFLICPYFGPLLQFFWSSGAILFGPLMLLLEYASGSKNMFGTY